MEQLTSAILKEVIQKRPPESYKGTFGQALLIGGAPRYGGAIIMASEACVKAGCGLTTVVCAPENHLPLKCRCPEVMTGDWQDFSLLEDLLKTATVILIGPGLDTGKQARQLLEFVLSKRQKQQWLVIDGSALTLLAETKLENLPQCLVYPESVVLTPHQMEWQRLSSLAISQQTTANNQALAKKLGVTLVAKSHRSEIFAADGFTAKNTCGSPAMATGGMGDTLAGIICGFLAQFPHNGQTIAAALYLHSYIGEALAQENYVVLPTEISAALPKYMARFA